MSPLAAVLLVATPAAPQSEPHEPPSERTTTALRVDTERVEHEALARSLELRAGSDWRRWTITVEDGEAAGTIEVRLLDGDGHAHARVLTLMGETVDARSRELASALALIIDQLPKERTEPDPASSSTETGSATSRTWPSGWIGVGPRAGLNPRRTIDPDAGISLAGGTWLVREHLQPIVHVDWSRAVEGSLHLDSIRVGGGGAGGVASLRGRLWSGAALLLRAQWSRASAATVATGWWWSPAVMGVIQYRGRVLVAGAWVGVDLSLPPLHAYAGADSIRWAIVRPMATLHVGIRIPPGPRGADE